MHIAIVTAKGGNQTMTDKNLVDIAGKPCVYWPISAAQETGIIDDVYVTTECPKIKKVSEGFGAKVINRPDTLAQPLSNHGDVIVHAVKSIKLDAGRSIETVTILLGNTVMITSDDINTAIHKTMSDEAIDSCMTVWKAQDDHPYRAMVLGENGYLRSYSRGMTPDTNRQSYPDVYFYDQGPWTVRMQSLLRSEKLREGPGPWWWMGPNCVALERLWVTGRDIHSTYDVEIAEWWLRHYRLIGKSNPSKVETYK